METYHLLTVLHLNGGVEYLLKKFLEDLQKYQLIEEFKIENFKDVWIIEEGSYFTNQELVNYYNIYANFEQKQREFFIKALTNWKKENNVNIRFYYQ